MKNTLFLDILFKIWIFFTVMGVFFSNSIFRIPMPVLIGWPIIFFSWKKNLKSLPIFSAWTIPVIWVILLHGLVEWKESFVSFITFLTAVFVIHFWVGNDKKKLRSVIKTIIFCLSFSTIILCIGYFNPALNLKLRLLILDHPGFRTSAITGLTSEVFHFGYQSSAFVGLAVIYYSFKHNAFSKKMQHFIFITAMISMIFGMQRAVLGSFLIFLILLLTMRKTKILVMVLILFCIISFYGILEHLLVIDSVISKFSSTVEKNENVIDRFLIQVETIKLLFQHPFGTWVHGLRLSDLISKDKGLIGMYNIAPHNAYLTYMLEMGVLYIPCIIFILFTTFNAIRKVIYTNDQSEEGIYAKAISFALIGLLLNATLHNPSLFDSSSITVLFYVLFWHIYTVRFNSSKNLANN